MRDFVLLGEFVPGSPLCTAQGISVGVVDKTRIQTTVSRQREFIQVSQTDSCAMELYGVYTSFSSFVEVQTYPQHGNVHNPRARGGAVRGGCSVTGKS